MMAFVEDKFIVKDTGYPMTDLEFLFKKKDKLFLQELPAQDSLFGLWEKKQRPCGMN